MPAKLRWTPQAREDLIGIYVAIGRDNPDAAERLYLAVEDKVELLRLHARLGVRRPEIEPAARVLFEGPYVIVYEISPDTDGGPVKLVEIVRIVDGRRDLRRPF